MDLSKVAEYFKFSAERDWKTAQALFTSVKRYDACLFFCHIVLEKSLKFLVIKASGKLPPYSHDLVRLAILAGLKLTEKQKKNLRVITTFNISGRYDTDKKDFYKSCTKEYAGKYLEISKKLYLWLRKNYPEK